MALPIVKDFDKDLRTRITKSRIQALINQPFFGNLLLNMELAEVDKEYLQTAATDGQYFYYCKEFLQTLDDAELTFVQLHEVCHNMLGHLWRRGSRDHEKFNIACDYAIHSILKDGESSSTYKFAKGALYDPKFNGKSAEEIYDMLPDSPTTKQGQGGQNGKGQGQGQGQSQGNGKGQKVQGQGQNGAGQGGQKTFDDHSVWDDAETQQNANSKTHEWQDKMMAAAEAASGSKDRGSVPGSLQRLIGKLKKPEISWREVLQNLVTSFIEVDYTFNPPEKRMIAVMDSFGSDIMLPSFSDVQEVLENIVFAIDTSGSIGEKELTKFISEIRGLFEQYNEQVKIKLVYYDSEVAAAYNVESVDDLMGAKPAGGGGTNLKSVYDWVDEQLESGEMESCGAVVALTDMYDSFDFLSRKYYDYQSVFVSTSADGEGSMPPEECGAIVTHINPNK